MKESINFTEKRKMGILPFWEAVGRGVKINNSEFKRLLESHGFGKLSLNSCFVFVKKDNNIVQTVNTPFIKDYVVKIVNETSEEDLEGVTRSELMEAVINSGRIFSSGFFEFLPTVEINFLRDTKDESFFFFRNGLLRVGRNEIKLTPYSGAEGCFRREDLLERDFIPTNGMSVFERFCINVTANNPKRLKALMSSIGYMLHRYKDPSIPKVVVFTDELISEDSFGRSGKGLTINAISHLRKTIRIDGRNLNMGRNFLFQRCEPDTSIIAIEDLRRSFPFNRLFSLVTDGVAIEKKNKDERYLSYADSPKFMISSNFIISGLDDSTIGRQFTVEYAPHYREGFSPYDEFGQLFFDEWSPEEWNRFDNFMVGCVRDYLANGLQSYKFVNLEKKRFTEATSAEFVEFIENEERIEPGRVYVNKHLFDEFVTQYPDFSKLSRKMFVKWLRTYADLNGLRYEGKHSGCDRQTVFCVK